VRHAKPRMGQGFITFRSGSLSPRPRHGSAMLTTVLSAVEALAPKLTPVRVNAVSPGFIDTALLHTAYGVKRDTIMKNRAVILPGRREGTGDKVAQVTLMLMTNDDRMRAPDGGTGPCKWGWPIRVTRLNRFRM
jgi:NAD(P)-dependent dehydrogenase (short-subunit alcohol dehydrogenase family)